VSEAIQRNSGRGWFELEGALWGGNIKGKEGLRHGKGEGNQAAWKGKQNENSQHLRVEERKKEAGWNSGIKTREEGLKRKENCWK